MQPHFAFSVIRVVAVLCWAGRASAQSDEAVAVGVLAVQVLVASVLVAALLAACIWGPKPNPTTNGTDSGSKKHHHPPPAANHSPPNPHGSQMSNCATPHQPTTSMYNPYGPSPSRFPQPRPSPGNVNGQTPPVPGFPQPRPPYGNINGHAPAAPGHTFPPSMVADPSQAGYNTTYPPVASSGANAMPYTPPPIQPAERDQRRGHEYEVDGPQSWNTAPQQHLTPPHPNGSVERSSSVPAQMPQAAAIAPADASVEALAEFARELIRRIGGRLCGTQYVIERGAPVRTGLRCVSCKCVTPFGRPGSVLLFAPGRHFKTHQALVDKQWFEKYRGMVCEVVQATQARDKETDLIVDMPHIVITEPLPAIDEQLGPLPQLRWSLTIDAVARELAAQLADLHGHRIVHNGVARANVVQRRGNVSIWTFREYCSSSGLGRDVDVAQQIPDVRLAAPELGPALRRGLMVKASAATDIWQLGTLLFELYTGRPYWRQGMSREDIISALCQSDSLPHELNPTLFDAVRRQGTPLQQQQLLLSRMLSRRPELRPNARALERDFAKLAADQATVQGNTIAPWQEVSETRLG